MRYTIITPTICRKSLLRLCVSIDSQTESNWEHLVVIDMPRESLTRDQREFIASIPPNENRSYSYCNKRHNNYGHTCRHQAWENAKGDYILYIDDDDYLADNGVLRDLDFVTEPWAVFPVSRHGRLFLGLPPGTCRTGTGMFIHKRDIGRWPDSDSYEADGSFVESLREKYPYEVVDTRPMVVQPKSSAGVSNAETWFGNKLRILAIRWLSCRYFVRSRFVLWTAKRGG
jgi:glycosyltransferase involved in cell wall biosynthesis